MTDIAFKRIDRHQWRIYQDRDIVGDVCRIRDILNPERSFFVVHLSEEHVAARDMLRRSRTACVAIGATRTAAT